MRREDDFTALPDAAKEILGVHSFDTLCSRDPARGRGSVAVNRVERRLFKPLLPEVIRAACTGELGQGS